MRINELLPVSPLSPVATPDAKAPAGAFQDVLKEAIRRVEGSGAAANDAVQQFITGENQDLHTVALKTQRASLDFELLLQVRNKVVQTYQEIMRMQL